MPRKRSKPYFSYKHIFITEKTAFSESKKQQQNKTVYYFSYSNATSIIFLIVGVQIYNRCLNILVSSQAVSESWELANL